MNNTIIKRTSLVLLCCCLALLLTHMDSVTAQTITITPPNIGGVTPDATKPVQYMLTVVRIIMLIAFVVLGGYAMVTYGGGLISELNEARQRGEWGKFGAFLLIGILVILIVLFAGFWANSFLDQLKI